MTWQRARRPEQKRQRREDLLDAAAELFDEEGYDQVSLTALAERAGVSKASIYRYFESKEDIFLKLLLADTEAWIEAAEHALAPLAGSDDPERVGRAVAKTLMDQPRFCALVSRTAGVLEHNITEDAGVALKSRILTLSIRGINALHAAMPSLSLAAAQQLIVQVTCLIAGMWPAAHPSPTMAAVLARPTFAAMCVDLARDLPVGIVALIRGLMTAPPGSR